MNSFVIQYRLFKQRAEKCIENSLPAFNFEPKLLDAVKYSLFSAGKRLRPVLVYAANSIFEPSTDADCFAVAIELVHTYSLVHDDLPCMDNSDYRREKLSSHKVYGEGMALLVGDTLLNSAYEHLANGAVVSDNTNNYLQAHKYFAQCCGGSQLIGGQSVDACQQNRLDDCQTLEYLTKRKTAALFKCALYCGGKIGNADLLQLQMLEEYGDVYGTAFQIYDDIQDNEANKLTYVSCYGSEGAAKLAKEQIEKAQNIAKSLKSDFLADLATNLSAK